MDFGELWLSVVSSPTKQASDIQTLLQSFLARAEEALLMVAGK